MKVLMLANYYKPHIGGVERHLEFLCEKLLKKGHKITIITTKHGKNLKTHENYSNVEVRRITYKKIKFFGLIKIWVELIKNIKEFKNADLIHIHDVFIWYFPIRLLLPNKKVYMTFHGYRSYPLSKKDIFIQKMAAKLTDGNICIGSFIEKWYGIKADIISYGAVDLNKFRSKKVNNYKYDGIFASRLDDQTGILTYIKAAEILNRRGVDFKLLVLGDGKYLNKVKNKAIAKGFVDDPEAYYSKSKFAFVNRYLAILEAFSAKKLVFAVYEDPLKKDYLEMTPYIKMIVCEKDPKNLADRIIYYSNHPKEENKITQKAHLWVQKMTWDKMADNYLNIWKASK